jgi:tetratricopeptide (TPR) repeat protein
MKSLEEIGQHRLTPVLVLISCAYLLFASTFNSPWLMDDFPVILQNPAILSLSSFIEHTNFMRPLREISLMIDYKLFGFNSSGYHVQQIFWHGLNTLMIFHVSERIGLRRRASWIAALLFLVHPVHVEVLANISHRKDSLALAFALMSLLAYQESFKDCRRRWLWWLTTLFCAVMGFLAKGNVIIMPLILWLYETAFIPTENRMLARYNRYIPLFAILGVAALTAWYFHIWNLQDFRVEITRAMPLIDNNTQVSPEDYFLMVMKSIAFMASKLVWPLNLSMEYTYSCPKNWLDPWVLAAIILIISAALLLVKWRRVSNPLFFSLGWLLIFWLPISNLVWHFSYFAADRYLYAPSAGVCIMFAALFDSLTRQCPQKVALLTSLSTILVLAVLTWQQNLIWIDYERFYQHMLQVSPTSKIGIIGLSNYYARRGKLSEALKLLEPPLKIDPLYIDPSYYNQAGTVYSAMGNYNAAISFFGKAIEKDPDNIEYLNALGVALEKSGRRTEAEFILRKAVDISANNVLVHYNLGVSLYGMGRLKDANDSFLTVMKLDPYNTDALFNLAVVQADLGMLTFARESLARLRLLDSHKADELEGKLAGYK